MCDMLTDQNYAAVEAALTEGTMPTDSRSIVQYRITKLLESALVYKLPAIRFHILTPPLSRWKVGGASPFSRGNTAF